ncbi:MAG: Crp/Fnr family transcriptional regulator [Deltaproteobacteria bacterium]
MDLPHHQACRGLTEALNAMAPELPRMGRKRTLRAGEALYRTGDPTETAFLIVRGRIRAVAPGRLDSYGPGELVGELCFCAVRARQEAASATQATDVVELGPAQLVAAARRNEAFANGLLEWYCHRLGEARQLAGEAQLAPAEARVARRLLELALSEGIADGAARILVRRPTHVELARAALVSRERTSKVLSALRARGDISYGRTGPLRVLPERLRLRVRAT